MSSSNNNDNKPSGHDSVVDDFGEDGGATRGDLPTRSKDLEFEYQLLHDCYGGFGIIDEYKGELKRRTDRDYRIFASRDDPELLKLYKEKGSKWVSGPHSQTIAAPFPVGFKRYVYEVVRR